MTVKVENGTVIQVCALEWREDWEFDFPTVILRPVHRYSPNGDGINRMIEELGIKACAEGELKDENDDDEFQWRGWSWARLHRVFNESLRGKEFPKKGYRARRVKMRFILDDEGDLSFITE